ncbi:MAG TPA: glycosyltransferase family 2 protein [Candidatus Saccharimonadales bacterium]|nr:glycosyltransferase family 2 protein [Candidatus Saccharimonadales bacterium]
MNADTYVIIPVYNEGQVIEAVAKKVLKKFKNVVCVNDGSRDDSALAIERSGAKLVSHPVNLGQGGALQTGIEFALLDPNAKYFVTFDADGQHGLDDVETMLAYARKHPDVDAVLGSRFLGKAENITPLKKLTLKAAVLFSNMTTGLQLTDAHNGLRVFNRRVAEALDITMSDMAHASEIIHRIAEHKFVYKEMPVTIVYTDYSRAKGQSIMNAINITFDLFLQRLTKK